MATIIAMLSAVFIYILAVIALKILTKEQINELKSLIIDRVITNPDVMFDENNIHDDGIPDVINIIVGMFEYIYQLSNGNEYDYLWHYANKIGAWCNTHYLYTWLNRR